MAGDRATLSGGGPGNPGRLPLPAGTHLAHVRGAAGTVGPAAVPEDPLSARALVLVCHGPSCTERGSPETLARLRAGLAHSPARRHVQVCTTTCLDNCATGPNVLVTREGAITTGMLPSACDQLVSAIAATVVRPAGD